MQQAGFCFFEKMFAIKKGLRFKVVVKKKELSDNTSDLAEHNQYEDSDFLFIWQYTSQSLRNHWYIFYAQYDSNIQELHLLSIK